MSELFAAERASLGVGLSEPGAMSGEIMSGEIVPYEGEIQPHAGSRVGEYLAVEHIADAYRRYPGEIVTFMTRVVVRRAVEGFTVRVRVPSGLMVRDYRSRNGAAAAEMEIENKAEPVGMAAQSSAIVQLAGLKMPPAHIPNTQPTPAQHVVWRVEESQQAGDVHEVEVSAVVEPIYVKRSVRSQAWIYRRDGSGDGSGDVMESSAEIDIAIEPKGRYLEHLPALYEQDDFMGRFLMLFESFWKPISKQISNIPDYFDPLLTPPEFLPWLAHWFNLEFGEFWSERQQRKLLVSIMWLYRRRGTRQALEKYLEIFTERPVEIAERRARNLRLGASGRLGQGVALGTGNVPHTFVVRVQLPPLPTGNGTKEAERERQEQRRRRVIETIIDAEKPAHTTYTLHIELEYETDAHADSGSDAGTASGEATGDGSPGDVGEAGMPPVA